MDAKEQAKQYYLEGMAIKDIADKLGKTAGTVRSWKSRGKWDSPPTDKEPKKSTKKDATQRNKKSATLQRNTATQHENVATLDEDELDADGLTSKQAQFAYLVANGMSKSGAYREAYDVERMSDNSIWVEASKVSVNPKVTLRIKQIQTELLELSGWSRERSYSEKNKFLEEVKQTFENDGRITQGAATAFMSVVTDLDNMLESDMKRKQRADADIADAKAKEMAIEQSDIQTEIEFVFDRGDAYEED